MKYLVSKTIITTIKKYPKIIKKKSEKKCVHSEKKGEKLTSLIFLFTNVKNFPLNLHSPTKIKISAIDPF